MFFFFFTLKEIPKINSTLCFKYNTRLRNIVSSINCVTNIEFLINATPLVISNYYKK